MKRTCISLSLPYSSDNLSVFFSNTNSKFIELSQENTYSTPEHTWNLFKTAIMEGILTLPIVAAPRAKPKVFSSLKKWMPAREKVLFNPCRS